MVERFKIFMCAPLFVTNTLFRKIRSVKRYRATTGTSRQLKKAIADIMADLTEVPIRACKYVTSKVSRALLGGQDAYVTSGIWRRPGLGV